MTDATIQNFAYFLKELEKNLINIQESLEKEHIALQKTHIICSTMTKMCQNWEMQPNLWE